MHQDIVEIEQLLYRYCYALDRGTVDEVIEAFHRVRPCIILFTCTWLQRII
jgi:hypothetical protein